jgi:hypothetical protein
VPDTLGEVLGVVAAILAVAAATSASLYLLVLAPREPIYAIVAIFLFAAFISLLYFGLMKTPAAAPPPSQPQIVPVPAPPPPKAAPPPPQETVTYIARLETPDGKIVPITSIRQVLGRRDFEKLVDPALARAISREHFTIYYDFRAGKFFIEDRSSTNGTLHNGTNIRGRGPIELKEGDTISPAGVLNLTFKIGS